MIESHSGQSQQQMTSDTNNYFKSNFVISANSRFKFYFYLIKWEGKVVVPGAWSRWDATMSHCCLASNHKPSHNTPSSETLPDECLIQCMGSAKQSQLTFTVQEQ